MRLISIFFAALTVFVLFFSGVLSPFHGAYFFFAFMNAFLYSHFILGFWASRRRFLKLTEVKAGRLWLGGAFLTALFAATVIHPELSFIYFGFHFAFSEAYSIRFFNEDTPDPIRPSHLGFLLCGYFFATAHTFAYTVQPPAAALTGLHILLGLGMAGFFLNYLRQLNPTSKADRPRVVSDSALMLAFVGAAFYKVHWTGMALIHITFWLLLPKFAPNPKHREAFWRVHLLPTVVLFLICLSLYPAMPAPADPEYGRFLGFSQAFVPDLMHAAHRSMRWGIFHIVFSLVLSPLNPRWLVARQP